ncbi:MAG TPA: hypothetical protein DEO70_04020 [Bacteroidales bacterium]|nr:MAG: hypothetical protein A2X11_00995 [Bacteroidetes bacterium GWE2_42_24]OFY27464.1 MAG: hypothetical protein A2X09_07230 [Bacteroidetes bacterium GWF2_43_11]PKP20154.1 MAG: hypothetical protein CVU06_10810 [Bacteroidetes bacterium HGW-Bacteroidetes-22]HBZ65980.1 hypothetical protein [Bacteroidales bacterium]
MYIAQAIEPTKPEYIMPDTRRHAPHTAFRRSLRQEQKTDKSKESTYWIYFAAFLILALIALIALNN